MNFPTFDQKASFLNIFLLDLVNEHRMGEINSWDVLDKKVKSFFTAERLHQTESLVPGWIKMTSYSDGITLTHVMCVFLGIIMLPEYEALTEEEQQLSKWVVLLHDVEKFHIRGKKDTMHAFKSGVNAAKILPSLGFSVTNKYANLIDSWSSLTLQAFTIPEENASPKPDNQKLPEILSGIDQLFGENSPASLIIKVVLLHISLDVDPFYPTPAPLKDDEIKRFISPNMFPVLKVMLLGDSEGWSMFEPESRKRQRDGALNAFQKIEKIIKI
jgi:hypothetical protein